MNLLGFEIDDKYKNATVKVASWWNDAEMPIKQLALYLKSNEFKEDMPEFIADCEKVAKEFIDSLESEDKATAKTTKKAFTDYLRELESLYPDLADKCNLIRSEKEEAIKKWNKNAKEFANDDAVLARCKVSYYDKLDRCKNDKLTLLNELNKSVDSIRTALEAHLNDFYSLSGKHIDDETVKLLNSGIKITESEADSLAQKYKGNPTMIRVLSDYCDKNKIRSATVKALYAQAKENGNTELKAFDNSVEMLRKCLSDDDTVSKIWCNQEKKHYQRINSNIIQDMDDLLIKPM